MVLTVASVKETPLPLAALAILMLCRMAEPIQYTVIFPFINEMVAELGVTDNEEKLGYYSGIIESVFAFVQFFTVWHWAVLSDRWGRKPVIMMGLLGTAISGSLFGFSKNFFQMLVTRCLSGALNGNVAVVRAAVGDITDETNSTEAFAIYGLVWTVGSIIGNSIGGYLSHPVERIPKLFHRGGVLEAFPFLLPCLVTTSVTLCGLLFTFFCLKESHQGVLWSRARKALGRPDAVAYKALTSGDADPELEEDDDDIDADNRTLVGDPDSPKFSHSRDSLSISLKGDKVASTLAEQAQSREAEKAMEEEMAVKPFTLMMLLSYRAIVRQMSSLFLLSFIGGAWGSITLLFMYTPTAAGGLGISTAEIGSLMACQGVWSIACQLLLLGRVRRRFGIAGGYRFLNCGYILVFLYLPMIRSVVLYFEGPHAGEDPEVSRSIFTYMAILLFLGLSTFVGMANSLSMVLVNLCTPDRAALGAINGLSTAVGCAARVIGPALSSALFAASMDSGLLGGHAWWMFMVTMCIVSAFVGFLIDDRKASKEVPKDIESMSMQELHQAVDEESRIEKQGTSPDFLRATGNGGAMPPINNVTLEAGKLETVVEEPEQVEVAAAKLA